MELSHHDLSAWKAGVELVKLTYVQTRQFPADERFGLTAQMRRAAVSVPSNIAEGAARKSKADFLRHLMTARASLAELETQLRVAVELEMLTEDGGRALEDSIQRTFALLSGLIRSVERQRASGVASPEAPPYDEDH